MSVVERIRAVLGALRLWWSSFRRYFDVFDIVLLLARICLVLSTGYIHPDEHFQSCEIASNYVFNISSFIPWEYGGDGNGNGMSMVDGGREGHIMPIRSFLFPYISCVIPYNFVQSWILPYVGKDSLQMGYVLFLAPRIYGVLVSFLIEYLCFYRICVLLGHSNIKCAFRIFNSSNVALLYFHTSFSNTWETYLYIILIWIIFETRHMCRVFGWLMIVLRNLIIGVLISFSFWIRFTSIIYMTPWVIYLFFDNVLIYRDVELVEERTQAVIDATRGIGGKKNSKKNQNNKNSDKNKNKNKNKTGKRLIDINTCKLSMTSFLWSMMLLIAFLGASIFFIVIDNQYFYKNKFFEPLTVNTTNTINTTSTNRRIPTAIVTPINAIMYNMESSNVESHGKHPLWLHLIVNMQLLFGPLFIYILRFILLQYNFQTLMVSLFYSKHIAITAYSHREYANQFDENNENKNSNLLFDIDKQLPIPLSQKIAFWCLLTSIVFPLLVFSMISHQEARFLLPLFVPICLIGSSIFDLTQSDMDQSIEKQRKDLLDTAQRNANKNKNGKDSNDEFDEYLKAKSNWEKCNFKLKSVDILWYFFNFFLCFWFGILHESGLIPALYRHKGINIDNYWDDVDFAVFYRTFMPPRTYKANPFKNITVEYTNIDLFFMGYIFCVFVAIVFCCFFVCWS